MNTMKLKYLFRGALVAFALVALAVAGRVVAGTYSTYGNLQEGAFFFENEVHINEALVQTPVTKTAAFTVDLTENAYDLDSTAGAFLISLPDATVATTTPFDGQCWDFTLTVANGATSLSPSAIGNLLDASQAAYAGIDAVGDSARVCYDSGTGDYLFKYRYIH